MSRRRRPGLSPSLFPFLAVLVCTLGTLILFLALVAQNATESAQQRARAQKMAQAQLKPPTAEPESPKLSARAVQAMLDEEQFRAEQLVSFRQQQTSDLGQRRDQLTHLDDHIDRLRAKLKRLTDEVAHATGDVERDAVNDDDIARLRRRIAEEQAAVEELREDARSATPRVVIVPHKGPNGTDRRPVYLECTQQGVTVWPEGARITVTQLEDSDYSANPLDAALRTVRWHVMQNYGDTSPPYPLLVVRPEGIEAYAAARSAMRDWDDQFGYELVPSDVELAYSKPDPNLKRRLDVAIREAVARQRARHAIARNLMGSSVGVHDHRGGSGYGDDGRRRQRLPTLSAAQLDREGRSSGFGSLRESAITGRPSRGSGFARESAYGSGVRSGSVHANPYDDAGAAAREWTDQMRSAAGELRQSQNSRQEASSSGGDPATQDAALDREGDRGEESSHSFEIPDTNRPGTSEGTDGPNHADVAASGSAGHPPPAGATSSASFASISPSQPPGSPSSSQPPNQVSAAPPSSLVRREGRDWALPPSMAGMGGNAIVRTLRVQCYADRFVLLPPAAGGPTEMFGLSSGDIEQATLRLATAVRDRIERWGPALVGGRWQPRLDVIVMPGGEHRFHQLRTWMRGSGVEVNGRPPQ